MNLLGKKTAIGFAIVGLAADASIVPIVLAIFLNSEMAEMEPSALLRISHLVSYKPYWSILFRVISKPCTCPFYLTLGCNILDVLALLFA